MTFDALFLRFLIFGLLLAVFTFTEVKLAFGRNPSHNAHGYSQDKHHNQSPINTTVPSIVPPLGERELCFREQPRTCAYDYSFRPAPLVLMQPRSRDDKTGSWNSVPLPYKAPRRKVNILYLSPNHKFYLHGMDRQFYDEMDAAIGHPDVEVFHFGVKFPGWNETWSLAENLNSKFPGIQFDIVYSKDFYQEYDSRLTNPVVTHTFGDCWNPMECSRNGLYVYHDVIGTHYAGLLMDLFRPEQWKEKILWKANQFKEQGNEAKYNHSISRRMPFFFHQTHCVQESVFYPTKRKNLTEKWEDSRPHLIQFYGAVNPSKYQLRTTMTDGIKAGIIKNATIWGHPGYDLPSGANNANCTLLEDGRYHYNDPRVEPLRKTQRAFAQALRDHQICLFDSSHIRKAIRKYHEAFFSGCVVAADVPIEMEEMFRDVVIPLRKEMTAEEVNEVVQEYLKDKERLAWMAEEAFYRARQHWTCRNRVDRLLEVSARVLRGERGYWFPFGFSATCRHYPNMKDYSNGYC